MFLLFQLITWSFVLYVCHRLGHSVSFLWYYHKDHHIQVSSLTNKGYHWSNYFLFFDTWKSTLDQWLIEIIPTILLSLLFKDFTLCILYYIWAVFIQERIEHNSNFNIYPILTSGKWHLEHHGDYSKNYGVFTPIWDIFFQTHVVKKWN